MSDTHYFRVDDAVKYGTDKAAILQNIRFWLEHSKANGKKAFDGYHWTYNSAKAFTKLIPYISQTKMTRLLKELESDGVIISGNYNKVGYDRTKWYTMPEYAISQKCEMESSEMRNGSRESEEPIPDSKPDEKPDAFGQSSIDDAFDMFWDAGMRKVGKKDALASFKSQFKKAKPKLKTENKELEFAQCLIKDVKARLAANQLGFDAMHPKTYLNGQRWRDERPKTQVESPGQEYRGPDQPIHIAQAGRELTEEDKQAARENMKNIKDLMK